MVSPGEPPRLQGGQRDGSALRIELERSAEAPALARAALAGFLEGSRLASGRRETLTLLVSELMSNAVMHSDAPGENEILLCVRWVGRETIRVEVTDRGSGFVRGPRERTPEGGGYGLYIVEKQTTRWGVDRRDGTRVWFELSSGERQADASS